MTSTVSTAVASVSAVVETLRSSAEGIQRNIDMIESNKATAIKSIKDRYEIELREVTSSFDNKLTDYKSELKNITTEIANMQKAIKLLGGEVENAAAAVPAKAVEANPISERMKTDMIYAFICDALYRNRNGITFAQLVDMVTNANLIDASKNAHCVMANLIGNLKQRGEVDMWNNRYVLSDIQEEERRQALRRAVFKFLTAQNGFTPVKAIVDNLVANRQIDKKDSTRRVRGILLGLSNYVERTSVDGVEMFKMQSQSKAA